MSVNERGERNSDIKSKKEIKMTPEMLNLLGCTKDNFKKLLRKMSYKITEKENEVFFKYSTSQVRKTLFNIKISNENPFGILTPLHLN